MSLVAQALLERREEALVAHPRPFLYVKPGGSPGVLLVRCCTRYARQKRLYSATQETWRAFYFVAYPPLEAAHNTYIDMLVESKSFFYGLLGHEHH